MVNWELIIENGKWKMKRSRVDWVTHACRCWCSSPTAKNFRRIVVGEEH